MVRVSFLLPLVALVAACAGPQRVAAPAAAALPPPPTTEAPRPPDGAAAGLTIPARLADGGYATPNRSLSPAGHAWHLRAAFNVAALNCGDPTLAATYNRVLTVHRAMLTAAHRSLMAEHGGLAKFDPAMTRLYNYFAQPPVMARFCATVGPLMQQAAVLSPGDLSGFSGPALAQIDRPYGDFYTRYDAWRTERAAWRPNAPTSPAAPAAPRLVYDSSVFATVATVTGGSTTLASR